MAASGATGSGFRARVGTLTLLYAAGSADREVLAEVLEGALDGGLLRALQEDEAGTGPPAADEYEESEDFEDDDEFEVAFDEPPRVSDKGLMLLHVIETLKGWLRRRPAGPLELGHGPERRSRRSSAAGRQR